MKRFILMALLLPGLVKGQTIAEKADELLTAYTTQNKFSGNVLIAKKGKIIFEKAYGYADRAKNQPNNIETEFRVGSLTKMFTSTVILKLVESSRISLNDPLSKFVPGFLNGDNIQIRHLLSHTSGIKGNTEGPEPKTLAESVTKFHAEPSNVKPGEHFEYNNFNYILLSYIAQKVTGKNYPDLMREMVLNKIGMTHSGLDRNDRASANKALGYVTNPQTVAWVERETPNVAIASGAGALYTTLDDLYKWSEAIDHHTLLPAATYQKAFTPVKGNYGFGWIVNSKDGKKEISHSGAIEGFIANFIKYPEEDITIILLSNYQDTDGRQLSDDLSAIVFNKPYKIPVQKKEIALSNEILNSYAGVYQLNENFTVTVSVENNRLYALAQGDSEKIEFTPESETKFYLKGPETEIEFIKENGTVKYLFINIQGGQKLTKM
jgi:CubicO group peptidase (beta-lactamase class C family)